VSAARADDGFFARVYALVRRIPRGRVATYGQLAALLGVPRGARAVGWALRGIGARAATVPWHRVVGHGGRISLDGRASGLVQRKRLRAEGVRFVSGRVDMSRHGLLSKGGTSFSGRVSLPARALSAPRGGAWSRVEGSRRPRGVR
jgi:methylated-DNA-protein-cysteine methyltransferase-like protein